MLLFVTDSSICQAGYPSGGISNKTEMEYFNKHMALEVIEDALTGIGSAYGRGVAAGLCSAFYICGLLSEAEWKAFLKRIPIEH
ncbi:MAG: hypothetical protein WDM70_11430 [Nitrosomonadales bacterium]